MPFAQDSGDRAQAALRNAQLRPLWLDSPDRPAARESLTGHISTGLVVVGAGLSGLWTALRAKQRHPDAAVSSRLRSRMVTRMELTGGQTNSRNFID